MWNLIFSVGTLGKHFQEYSTNEIDTMEWSPSNLHS